MIAAYFLATLSINCEKTLMVEFVGEGGLKGYSMSLTDSMYNLSFVEPFDARSLIGSKVMFTTPLWTGVKPCA